MKIDYNRYARQIRLPGFGTEVQEKLSKAKILVVGAGGLGCPALQYLAAAGVGTIGIIDQDLVSRSNLHRQILFNEQDCGKKKAEVAAEKLKNQNIAVEIDVFTERLTAANAEQIISKYDVILDGTDNFATRYLVNDACVLLDKTNIFASVYQYEGQVSVFNEKLADGSRGPNYRDIFPEAPPPELIPNCADAGVLGALTGMVGSLQALEALKVCGGFGTTLSGKMMIIDALNHQNRIISITQNPLNPLSGDHPEITEIKEEEIYCFSDSSGEISVQQLKTMKAENEDLVLIDVREEFEHQEFNIGGENIPLSNISEHSFDFKKGDEVVLYCQVGMRSRAAAEVLRRRYSGIEVFNLTGGIAGMG